MPFVLLVLVLLGGGLICLLVVNTTLGATSFRISQLQSTGAALATQEQTLQQQIAAEQSPAQIATRAYDLGMRAQTNTNILDLATHRFYVLPGEIGVTTQLGASSTASQVPAAAGTTTHRASGGTAKSAKETARKGKKDKKTAGRTGKRRRGSRR